MRINEAKHVEMGKYSLNLKKSEASLLSQPDGCLEFSLLNFLFQGSCRAVFPRN
jgi:hypothetical protein